MRKTKIICTIGPASDNEETLREMILSGMDVARLNFSHGEYSGHKQKADLIKKLRGELGTHTALMLDTKGPEIRIGTFTDGRITLNPGERFTLYPTEVPGDRTQVSISFPELWRDVKPGSRILIDDGLICLEVEETSAEKIVTRVANGGTISDRKSVNIPGVQISIPFMSEKDIADLEFGIREDFDFIAASFTQNAENIRQIRREMEKRHCKSIRIIAKIENAAGVENIDEIIDEADGIMVARGDMGVEIPMEDVPVIQKKLIRKCYNAGKQVITATQMLDSMQKNPRPTRAEITDVANAIYDGTSAIMLSGETASGAYPIEAVRTMATIATRAESDIDYNHNFEQICVTSFSNVTNAISHATCTTAHDLKAAAIISVTKSGQTARMLSRFRPETPIIGCAPDEKICRHMNMSWGVTPVLISEMTNTDELLEHAVAVAYKHKLVNYGDLVVITAGIPLGIPGTTNMLKVQIVGDVLTNGVGVNKGTVCGTLCVAPDEESLAESFQEGDIIVIPEATSKSINILREAKGIVCERGGMDSYAAIVGQALDIPVIVGATGATKILKSGTTVTIDASKGIVFSNHDVK